MEQLPQDIDIVNLSLGGYTDDDSSPLAIASALRAMRTRRGVVVAAAGNAGRTRPFWPAAFKQVLATGAVEPPRLVGVGSLSACNRLMTWIPSSIRTTA